MGNSSGKLVLKPIAKDEAKPEAASDVASSQPEKTAQLVNGDAPVGPDVPPIDGVSEAANGKETAKAETHDESPADEATQEETPVVNGKVESSEAKAPSGKSKKMKNPITWIQRRLSKNTKKQEQVASEGSKEADSKPEGDDEDNAKLSGVAEALVDEVITTVAASADQPTEEPKTEEASPAMQEKTEEQESPEIDPASPKEESRVTINNNNNDTEPVNHEESKDETSETNGHGTFDSEIPASKLLHQSKPDGEHMNGHADDESGCNAVDTNGSMEA